MMKLLLQIKYGKGNIICTKNTYSFLQLEILHLNSASDLTFYTMARKTKSSS